MRLPEALNRLEIAMKVLNFGSLNLDYVYKVDHFVQPGETLSAVSQTVNPGGKGLNQSIALARAGAEVFHAGCTGTGGEMLRALLQENGVDTSLLEETGELQGNAVIQVAPSGENCILLFGGSNQCITAEQIDRTLSEFSAGDWLVLQNEINMLPEIVDKAFEKGMIIVLNPSPYNEKLLDVDFGKLSWLLMNEVEAGQIAESVEPAGAGLGAAGMEKSGLVYSENSETGPDPKDADPVDAWNLLHGRYPGLSVLITLGKAGSMAFRVLEDGSVESARQDAFRVQAVDTTAAGDTYTGYFIGGLLEGLPLKECMRRASMASAISVTRPGAAGSIPSRAEVEAALA